MFSFQDVNNIFKVEKIEKIKVSKLCNYLFLIKLYT